MKTRLKFRLFTYCFLIGWLVKAQQATVTSGGTAQGLGGSSTATVGQLFYTNLTADIGTLAQGIQQAYEIYALEMPEEPLVGMGIHVYPNPVTNKLILDVGTVPLNDLGYHLFDAAGKLVLQQQIQSASLEIDMRYLAPAMYIFRIHRNNKSIKGFKIVKQ